VHYQPAALNRQRQTGAVFSRLSAMLVQERPVDLLDVNAALLDGLDAVGDLDQLAGGDVGNRARRSLAWSTFTASRGAPASIRAEAMIVLLKLAI
jgi:hypothetical protein